MAHCRKIKAGHLLVCPHTHDHRLSSDAEPHSYYCYACGRHYDESELAEIPVEQYQGD
jgi:hypothetical protein